VIWESIKGFFGAIGAVFGFASKRSDLNNTPEMKRRDEAQKKNNEDDKNAKAIRNADEDAVRKNLS